MNKENVKKSIHNILAVQRIMWQLDRQVCLTSVGETVISAVQPFIGIYLSAYVLDGLNQGREMSSLIMTAVLAVGSVFLLSLFKSYLKKVKEVHTNICVQKFEKKSNMRTLMMDYELLESPAVNNIRSRIQKDMEWGSGFYSAVWSLPELYTSVLGIGIAFSVVLPIFREGEFLADIPALAVLLLFFGIIIFESWFNASMLQKQEKLLRESGPKWLGYFLWNQQDYRQGKDIRIFEGQRLVQSYLNRDEKKREQWLWKVVRLMSGYGFGVGISQGLLQMTAYLFVALRAVSGAMSAGSVVKYAAAIYRFAVSVSGTIHAFTNCAIVAERQQAMMDYMNIENVIYKGTLPVEKRDDNEYEIEFHDVSFRYPGTEQYALEHVNFKFTIGKRFAVVGMNGSGKTTLIKLLCRLYDPTEGEITLNGINIKKYDYAEYMSIFSVVFQDFKLFSFTLGQNVAASVEYDRKKAGEALEKSGFGRRLSGMPKGLDTVLYQDYEKDGVEISGGEAQKIALARALYKDAPFIVLDEPTAALDPVAEYEIYSKFNEIVGQKTAIYISHRLSSCRFCDDIAVFDQGRLIQRGSHDSLVADEQGKYYELWHAQAQYYA